MSRPVFLSAKWRHLVLVNFEVEPEMLAPPDFYTIPPSQKDFHIFFSVFLTFNPTTFVLI